MENKKYIELAKKLYELSKRGVDGEKENAKRMLDLLMKKHDISIQDLETEKTQRRYFKYSVEYQGSIIKAVIFKVLNVASISFYIPPKGSKKKYFAFEITDFQYLEACVMINFYTRDFKNELGLFTRAYIIKQRIMSNIEIDDGLSPPLTASQKAENYKIALMAQGIDKKHYLKQLK